MWEAQYLRIEGKKIQRCRIYTEHPKAKKNLIKATATINEVGIYEKQLTRIPLPQSGKPHTRTPQPNCTFFLQKKQQPIRSQKETQQELHNTISAQTSHTSQSQYINSKTLQPVDPLLQTEPENKPHLMCHTTSSTRKQTPHSILNVGFQLKYLGTKIHSFIVHPNWKENKETVFKTYYLG